VLDTEIDQVQKVKTFCFETFWIKHPDFLPKMEEIWNQPVQAVNAVSNWCIKINRVKKFLKRWGLNLNGQTKRYRVLLQKELEVLEKKEEEEVLTPPSLDRKTFIQTELLKLAEEEELYWHKRSNEKWLLQGDSNTDFFHKKASGKKRRNIIFNLEKDGENINTDDEILKHATEFYKDLFGPSDNPIFKLDYDCWDQHERVLKRKIINWLDLFQRKRLREL
jgi:hypothetical protein